MEGGFSTAEMHLTVRTTQRSTKYCFEVKYCSQTFSVLAFPKQLLLSLESTYKQLPFVFHQLTSDHNRPLPQTNLERCVSSESESLWSPEAFHLLYFSIRSTRQEVFFACLMKRCFSSSLVFGRCEQAQEDGEINQREDKSERERERETERER